MIVPIRPPLEGAAADRFLALARSLANARQRNSENDLRTLLDEEVRWVRARYPDEDQVSAYEAAARVLLDLVRLGWQVREEGYGIELVTERPRLGRLTPEQILAEKCRTRELFRPVVEAQLREPAVSETALLLFSPQIADNYRRLYSRL